MRLHRLEVTAFGPFAGTVSVDFDDLGSTGLFLLTGPTGAGKSSVLDAVCFALYGEVPGDRQQARHLRSDHAPADRVPQVVLTTSIAGRTFRFTRSPAWERPKRRGTGTTRQQPSVLVEEHRDGTWTGLATRLDDAGLLVSSLLGMTCAQFTQVAMLPQGRFQAFLRASSAERHAVLQRLFRTDRFEQVERWLVEHRSEVRRASDSLGLRVAGHVHRLQEAGATSAPDDWDLDDLELPAARGDVSSWAHAVAAAAQDAHEIARAEHLTADRAAIAAAQELALARATAALGEQGRAAAATLAALERDAPEAERRVRRLAEHQRAVTVEPAARALAEAEAGRVEALDDARRTGLDAGLHLTGLTFTGPDRSGPDIHGPAPSATAGAAAGAAQAAAPDDVQDRVQDALQRAEARLARLRSALPHVAERLRLRADTVRLEHELAADRDELGRARTAVADLPARVRRLDADQRAAAAAALDSAAAEDALARAEAGVVAAREVVRTAALVEEGRLALLAATEEAQSLREAHLDAREARIASIASELAVGLVSGCSCPVCGSLDHPTPAATASSGSREAEELARRRYEDAETARMARHEAQAARAARWAALQEAAGGQDVAHWERVRGEAETRLAVACAAAEEARLLAEQRAAAAAALERATGTAATCELSVARGTERLLHLRSRQEALTAELDALGAGDEEDDVVSAVVAVEAEIDALHRTRAALERLRVLHDAVRRAHHRAQEACEAARFADAAEALAALLPAEEARSLATWLADRSADAQAARATLERPDVAEAVTADAVDLAGLEARVEEASGARDATAAALLDRQRAAERTSLLCAEIVAALDAWTPVREAASVVGALASFVEGKGPDNSLRMRLSAYVLAERLRQVVAAANERLAAMSSQRYTLEQADERGAGDRRGGLSLRVRDEWSGAVRDPVTLSGGETFVVALALALGLADTVSHEAGGTDIDTLFIDEGFGSLDAETLEEVMDTLDALREGGRTVGLVSHVPELRERITARLEVRKAREGSTLVLA
ncbi:MAG: AAA family ATPase [Marmoricola sp.]